MSRCTDMFVEVNNVTKGNGIWAHFALTGSFPSQNYMSRPIQKEDVQIETFFVYLNVLELTSRT